VGASVFISDPRIALTTAVSAWWLQATYPLAHAAYFANPALQFARKPVPAPSTVYVPTRHGLVRALVYAPSTADRSKAAQAGQRPPVHLVLHSGAFIVRMPEQEDNVARFLASELGCFVLLPDYATAPGACFPVAEQQVFDVFRWIRSQATLRGWDGARISVGGPSAGTKLACNVVQQCLDEGIAGPVALTSEWGTVDLSRSDARRPSPIATPVVTPALLTLVRDSYFAGCDLTDPLVSPYYDHRLDRFPPTLVVTAQHDALRSEMHEFAEALAAQGVEVTYHEVAGVDHGFTHMLPAEPAREALTLMAAHLHWAYAVARVRHAA